MISHFFLPEQVVAGLSDASLYSFVAFGQFAGYYITASASQIGGCSVNII